MGKILGRYGKSDRRIKWKMANHEIYLLLAEVPLALASCSGA